MPTRFTLLSGFALLLSPLASADDLSDAARKVTECRSISDDAARLICLDRASLALSVLLDAGIAAEVAPATPEKIEEAKQPEEPKWVQAPKPRKVEKPKVVAEDGTPKKKKAPLWARVLRQDDGSDDDLYPVTIVRITRNGAGRIFFYTESGQIWRQTQLTEVRPPKALPAGAVIQRSATGNPRLSFDDVPNRSYRVRRNK